MNIAYPQPVAQFDHALTTGERWERGMQQAGAQPWKPVATYATFHNVHGIAFRDDQGAVWFLPDDEETLTLLHDVDAADLQLHGQLDLIAQQAFLDQKHALEEIEALQNGSLHHTAEALDVQEAA